MKEMKEIWSVLTLVLLLTACFEDNLSSETSVSKEKSSKKTKKIEDEIINPEKIFEPDSNTIEGRALLFMNRVQGEISEKTSNSEDNEFSEDELECLENAAEADYNSFFITVEENYREGIGIDIFNTGGNGEIGFIVGPNYDELEERDKLLRFYSGIVLGFCPIETRYVTLVKLTADIFDD